MGYLSCASSAGPLRPLFFGTVLLSALSCGCGGGQPSYPVARLEGRVTLNGTAVADGTLQFHPQQADRGPPVQVEIREGRYSAPAVPLGKALVILNATRPTGKLLTERSEPRPEVVSIVPEKYRSGSPIEVKGDDPALNFDLTSP